MIVSAQRSRALLFLLIVVHAVWFYAAGWILMDQLRLDDESWREWAPRYGLVAIPVVAVLACVRTDVQSRWLDAMRNARLGYSRAFALMDAVGMAALFSGLVQGCHNLLNSDLTPTRPTEAWAVVFALCSVSLPVLARISARSGQNRFADQETSFFFW